jgi:hypothetical protein
MSLGITLWGGGVVILMACFCVISVREQHLLEKCKCSWQVGRHWVSNPKFRDLKTVDRNVIIKVIFIKEHSCKHQGELLYEIRFKNEIHFNSATVLLQELFTLIRTDVVIWSHVEWFPRVQYCTWAWGQHNLVYNYCCRMPWLVLCSTFEELWPVHFTPQRPIGDYYETGSDTAERKQPFQQ